jgi:hypothetical protein
VTQRDGKRVLACGRLRGDLSETEANAALLHSLACHGVELTGEWRCDRPGWRAADLTPAPGA